MSADFSKEMMVGTNIIDENMAYLPAYMVNNSPYFGKCRKYVGNQ